MTAYDLASLDEAPDLPHETTLGTRRAFDGHLLHVRVDDVRLPSGRESVREIVEHPGSAVVIAVTTDERELMEETGHRAGSIRELATIWTSPGYTSERSTLLLAEGCGPVPHEGDEDEPIQVVRVPLVDVPSLLEPGATRVHNAQAMIGLMWLVRLGMTG